MSVLVVGSVALDSVKTTQGATKDALGGSASFFSAAARHFAPVSVVAVVGEDFPPAYRKLFDELGVDTSGLQTAPGRTFRWSGEYTPGFTARHTLDTQLNVFADFTPSLTPVQREAKFVFLANIHPGLQGLVLDQVEEPDLVVLDTMNYWIERSREDLLAALARVDVVLVNDEEAQMLTGEGNLLRAAKGILEMGPDTVIVKKGEHGCLLVNRDFLFSIPALPLDAIVDPTGAGDTFAGGFVGYLAASASPRDEAARRLAAAYGTVLASFTVEAFSLDRLLRVTRAEMDERVGVLRDLVRF